MTSWENLTVEQSDILDAYITEIELVDAHDQAAQAILGGLAALLNCSKFEVQNMAVGRQAFLNASPYARAIADKAVDEDAWLAARRTGVTATEVAKLAQGQPAQRHNILDEKLTGERGFMGNKYTDFGLEREPFIAESLREFGFDPSDVLFHAVDNERHLATPDGVFVDENGLISILEIKTGKNDLHPDGDHFIKTTYMDQMQWQMYVMGPNCQRCLFAWEQHDNVWVVGEDGRERPTPLPVQYVWVARDDRRIDRLVEIADEFLADVDWARA